MVDEEVANDAKRSKQQMESDGIELWSSTKTKIRGFRLSQCDFRKFPAVFCDIYTYGLRYGYGTSRKSSHLRTVSSRTFYGQKPYGTVPSRRSAVNFANHILLSSLHHLISLLHLQEPPWIS